MWAARGPKYAAGPAHLLEILCGQADSQLRLQNAPEAIADAIQASLFAFPFAPLRSAPLLSLLAPLPTYASGPCAALGNGQSFDWFSVLKELPTPTLSEGYSPVPESSEPVHSNAVGNGISSIKACNRHQRAHTSVSSIFLTSEIVRIGSVFFAAPEEGRWRVHYFQSFRSYL